MLCGRAWPENVYRIPPVHGWMSLNLCPCRSCVTRVPVVRHSLFILVAGALGWFHVRYINYCLFFPQSCAPSGGTWTGCKHITDISASKVDTVLVFVKQLLIYTPSRRCRALAFFLSRGSGYLMNVSTIFTPSSPTPAETSVSLLELLNAPLCSPSWKLWTMRVNHRQ